MKKIIENNLPQLRLKGTKFLLTFFATISALSLFAQGAAPQGGSAYSNPVFISLVIIAVLLLLVIVVLGGVLVNVANATKHKWGKGKMSTIALLFLLFSGNSVFAAGMPAAVTVPEMNSGLLFLMLAVIGFEVLIIVVLLNAIQLFVKKDEAEGLPASAVQKPGLLEKLNASVAIEKEEEIMFDHVYDGIRELDNDLPPWWKYGFYATIVFAIVYLVHYHVISTGDLQLQEYNKSIAAAKIEKEEYEKKNAGNVNESNAKMLTDAAEIANGGSIFKESCAACHGQKGEGGVGPNLTDPYWLHGGSIKDIFSSIKYGWPDKGMKAWQADLSPVQIHQVTSYIITLNGTNPPNAKEKQGDLYMESGVTAVKDSVATDSVRAESI